MRIQASIAMFLYSGNALAAPISCGGTDAPAASASAACNAVCVTTAGLQAELQCTLTGQTNGQWMTAVHNYSSTGVISVWGVNNSASFCCKETSTSVLGVLLNGSGTNDTLSFRESASEYLYPHNPPAGLVGTIHGNGGVDTIYGSSYAGSDYSEHLYGDSGADPITGHEGDDFLYGGTGDDTLSGGDGADTIDGGADVDELSGDGGGDTLLGGSGQDTIFGCDFLSSCTTDDADTIRGQGDGDVIDGGAGSDAINGGDGDDVIDGGLGADTICGGALGDDHLEDGDPFAVGTERLWGGGTGTDTYLCGNTASDWGPNGTQTGCGKPANLATQPGGCPAN